MRRRSSVDGRMRTVTSSGQSRTPGACSITNRAASGAVPKLCSISCTAPRWRTGLRRPPMTPRRVGSTPEARRRATLVSGPMARSASGAVWPTSAAVISSPATTRASTSVRAISARHSVSPSTVLTPTRSTRGWAAAHSSATASSGSDPTSVSIHNRTERLLEGWMREHVSGVLELLREHALALDEQMLDELAAVPCPQRQQGRRDRSRPVQHAPQRLRELGVSDRTGTGQVHRAGDPLLSERVQDGADLVVDRNPAHVLASGAHAAAEAEAERQKHAREDTALATEDDAAPRSRNADAGIGRGRRRCFPLHADAGDEIVSRRALLVERLVAAIAVVADRRGRDEYRWRTCEFRERARQQRRAVRARLEDQALACVGPPLVADASAGKVDDTADAFEPGGVDRPRLGVPAELVRAFGLTTNESNHPITGAPERGHECLGD